MTKTKRNYLKPKIKSSKVFPISFYGEGSLRNPANPEYLLAVIAC